MPEYGKIVCVSIGYMTKNDVWKVDGIIGTEEEILNQTANIFNKALERNLMPCGYNIINFDLPWLNKKMIKYGIRVPYNILLFDKKPWNLKVLDLCDAWKMTTKYMTSLEVVTYELGLESPKTDMHGGEVHDVYWVENDINKISKYCNGDVKALVDIVEKFSESYGNI
jgi:predicted PolB exonuclease-like 3'-5' exonuclease